MNFPGIFSYYCPYLSQQCGHRSMHRRTVMTGPPAILAKPPLAATSQGETPGGSQFDQRGVLPTCMRIALTLMLRFSATCWNRGADVKAREQ